jgi:hypothetical protein
MPAANTLIQTYKGTTKKSTRQFQEPADDLAKRGYHVAASAGRCSPGFFTNKQVMTVTYVRDAAPAE